MISPNTSDRTRGKIYFFSYLFAPYGRAAGINRAHLCKYLSEDGWNICAISCANPQGWLSYIPKDENLLRVLPESVDIKPIKIFPWKILTDIVYLTTKFTLPTWNWKRQVYKKSESIMEEPGIIYTVGDPFAYRLGYLLKKKTGMPLVIDFRDPYIIDKQITDSADLIVCASEQIKREMKAAHKITGEVYVINNGYAFPIPIAERTHLNGKLNIIYTGYIGETQKADHIISAFKLMLEKHPELENKIIIHFYAPINQYVKQYLKKKLMKGVYLHNYVSFREMPLKIHEADVAYVTKTPPHAFPQKVYDYINAEKPMLVECGDVELKYFIEKYNIGRVSPFGDIESLANNMYEMYANRKELSAMRSRIRKIKPNFNMEAQAKKLSKLLQELSINNYS